MERVASRGVTMFSVAEVAALLLLLPFVAVAPAAAATGSSGCTTLCGNIRVEYPFGVEPGCYLDGFNLTCRKGELFLGDGTMQVLEISISNGTVRVNSSVIVFGETDEYGNADRSRTWGAGLRESGPYFLSGSANSIALVACNAQVDMRVGKNNRLVSSCTAICPSDDTGTWIGTGLTGGCSGIGCCQANIVLGYSSYDIQIHYLNGSASLFGSDLVYIVDQAFDYTHFTSNWLKHNGTVPQALPALLDWVISNSTCPMNASVPECSSAHSSCQDTYANGHRGYRCHCSDGYEGNPYVSGGCHDIDECAAPSIYPCYGDCSNTQGGYHCQCPHGFKGNASTRNGCKDIDECAHPDAYPCYGICINMPGTFHCRCRSGTYGDPFTKWGCIKIKNFFTEGNLADIIDLQVMEEEDCEVQEVAALAARCTKLKGEDRPTMREAEMILENLRVTKKHAPCNTRRRYDGDEIVGHYMSIEGVTKEVSRQYTMEEEILLSARYPR